MPQKGKLSLSSVMVIKTLAVPVRDKLEWVGS